MTPIPCTPKSLPEDAALPAAARAFSINPANRPALEGLHGLGAASPHVDRLRLAAARTRYWGSAGVHLTVSFLDGADAALRARILSHLNAWSRTAHVSFVETQRDGQVRIARVPGDGHWSYLGTDVLEIPLDQPTMNLDSFTQDTDDTEFFRVVRHEAGHTLGFVHEHVRSELIARIDRPKAYAYFAKTQRWSPEMVDAQVLTPLEESSLLGTATADARSIMCYQLPGAITVDGEPILGGLDIDDDDYALAAKLYPKPSLTARLPAAVPTPAPARTVAPVIVLANGDPLYLATVIDAITRGPA